MPSFHDYLIQGNPWLFFPVAIALGALHGLEPGHSKTMMTAYIVAIRGSVMQAVLLGISATLSHTAVIWILAFVGLHYSSQLDIEGLEPYFQIATGIIVIVLAVWMYWRSKKAQSQAHHHQHGVGVNGGQMVDTCQGFVEITVFENSVPPRFRLYLYDSAKKPVTHLSSKTLTIETIRPGGEKELFTFESKGTFLESVKVLPEPHEFNAVLTFYQGDYGYTYDINFFDHHHDPQLEGSELEFTDAHERAHAMEMQKHLTGREVTTGQVILFGLSGGLLPCPSAFAVLLVCLQLKKVSLGIAMVFAFSLGLAVTLVTVGMVAALSVHHVSKRIKGFGHWARRLPYASSTVMICIGLLVIFEGYKQLVSGH